MEGAGFSRLTLSEGMGRVQEAAPDTRRNSLNSASSTVELDFEMYMGDDPLAARAEALSYSQTLDDGSKHDDMLANFSEHEIFALCANMAMKAHENEVLRGQREQEQEQQQQQQREGARGSHALLSSRAPSQSGPLDLATSRLPAPRYRLVGARRAVPPPPARSRLANRACARA